MRARSLAPLVAVTALACAADRSRPDDGGASDATATDAAVDVLGADAVDARTDADVAATCAEMRERWHALIAALDATCTTDSDCAPAGGPRPGENSCACVGWIGGCGVAVKRDVYRASEGPALDDEYRAAGCLGTRPAMCDCGLWVGWCFTDGTCRTKLSLGCF